jgi:hypothetical protein
MADEYILVKSLTNRQLRVFRKRDVLPAHVDLSQDKQTVQLVNINSTQCPECHGKALILGFSSDHAELDLHLQMNRSVLEGIKISREKFMLNLAKQLCKPHMERRVERAFAPDAPRGTHMKPFIQSAVKSILGHEKVGKLSIIT